MLPLLRSQSAIIKSYALLLAMALLVACGGSVESDSDDSGSLPPGGGVDPDYPDYAVVVLAPGDDLETRAQEALITAQPKTIVVLPAGVYDFVSELSVSVDNIVLRGAGMTTETGTVLRFDNQITGAQGIFATGNNFVVQDLAVENTPGDSIKVEGSNGVTIQRVRIEWTNGPDENNGAYGLYPVQTRNVLIEDCEVRGASDAGVYVGQSEVIIVRRNYVYENVAGIEIENSKFADVYENNTTGNTGGILVFDLPGPPVQGGEATRVFNNMIVDNNEPNFAPEGNIVGTVPTGTGLMIMANDDIEAFGNTITGNQSMGVLVVSYYIADASIMKETYDPVPEKIFVHDNTMSNNAYDPQDTAAVIATLVFGGSAADYVYDSSGVGTNSGELLKEFPDGLSESQAICFVDNGPESSVGYFNATVSLGVIDGDDAVGTDPETFNCRHASLPPIVLEPPVDPEGGQPPVDTEALCGAEGTGLNTEAFVADCPNLSDYRLFADPANPLSNANDGYIYDLNTPLFTDYAIKYRFVFVPGESPAVYRSEDVFDFPVGTVIAKTFTIQDDLRDDASPQEIIETRLLIRRKEGWKALPYIWNQAKNDAELSLVGGSQVVSWTDVNGQRQTTNYVVPDVNDCSGCHKQDDKILPIGPKARHLNKDYVYDTGAANQLDYWTQQGILTGAPADKNSIVTIPLEGDLTASLDDRARGYLDVNCMHCHSPVGAAGYSGLWLEYSRPFGFAVGECKPPVAAGGGGTLDYVIVPGDASASIMDFRMDSNEPAVRMPEIGRSIIHTEGVQLVRDWINAMSGGCP